MNTSSQDCQPDRAETLRGHGPSSSPLWVYLHGDPERNPQTRRTPPLWYTPGSSSLNIHVSDHLQPSNFTKWLRKVWEAGGGTPARVCQQSDLQLRAIRRAATDQQDAVTAGLERLEERSRIAGGQFLPERG